MSHIHRCIGSQEEGVNSGSLLLYKKAPVSGTGHPLPAESQGGPGPDCHRLISRLESHNLVLGGSARRRAKKGCCRASPKVNRFAGSYSSMLSIRSKSWWCSSASEVRYRWGRRAGEVRPHLPMQWQSTSKDSLTKTALQPTLVMPLSLPPHEQSLLYVLGASCQAITVMPLFSSCKVVYFHLCHLNNLGHCSDLWPFLGQAG